MRAQYAILTRAGPLPRAEGSHQSYPHSPQFASAVLPTPLVIFAFAIPFFVTDTSFSDGHVAKMLRTLSLAQKESGLPGSLRKSVAEANWLVAVLSLNDRAGLCSCSLSSSDHAPCRIGLAVSLA